MDSVDWSKEPGYEQLCLPDGTEIASVTVYDNRKLPHFKNEFISRMKEFKEKFESKEDDVLIYGYMKSGTHWLWEIVRMFLDDQSNAVIEDVGKMDSFIECITLADVEKFPSPRILSTHLMPSGLPSAIFDNSKVIVPIRHPKDTAVSLYHHLKAETKGANLRCDWETFIDKVWFDPDLAFYATWCEFTSEVWKKCKVEANYHPVIYEQLLENPVEIIRDLGSFLGVADLTDERLEKIVSETRFDNLKANKGKSEKALESTFEKGYTMFRKGERGDWKNHFTAEQSEVFDKRMEEKGKYDNIRQVMMFFED